MQLVDILGWIGNIGFIFGSYLLAKRKVSGFYCFAFANTLYIISGFLAHLTSLSLISIYLVSMNIYGIINWNNTNKIITKGISK